MGTSLTVWTIRLSLVAMAGSLFLQSSRESRARRGARILWTVGCVLYVAHVVCAFHFAHDWSHAAAEATVAEQTAEMIGYRSGVGIYFNHLFTLTWIVDCFWWWRGGASGTHPAPRPWRIGARAFMLFIAVNGAMVFESGPIRWFGLLTLLGLFVHAIFTWRSHRSRRER